MREMTIELVIHYDDEKTNADAVHKAFEQLITPHLSPDMTLDVPGQPNLVSFSSDDFVSWASVGWTPGDVQSLFVLDDKEALDFLLRNGNHIRERMTELGWGVLYDIGRTEHLCSVEVDDA